MKHLKTDLKIKGLILAIGILFLGMGSGFAQDTTPVTWEIEVQGNASGGFEINFNAKIEEGWHLYSINPTNDPDDMGPLPTEFIFEENALVRLLDVITEQGELITKYEESFAMELNFYENEVTFNQKIGVRKNKDVTVKGEISFMVCDDEKCVFPDPEQFEIVINNN